MYIYATTLDILIGVTKNNFYDFDCYNHSKSFEFIVKGSSLLKLIPASNNRTCYDMYIHTRIVFVKHFFKNYWIDILLNTTN
uniref:Uncharacterized protein n=1 Tax=Strongyloides venezuelensis TaxID=75913 RepID=A0A0K0FZF7_STRVS